MSTNKTPNYQLHSWLPEDEFHLTEINENFTKLDASLKSEATAATQKANALETALGQRVRMVTGSYTGKTTDNKSSQPATVVTLGFHPKAVLAFVIEKPYSGPLFSCLAIAGDSRGAITITDTGFSAINTSLDVMMNYINTSYHYIALY